MADSLTHNNLITREPTLIDTIQQTIITDKDDRRRQSARLRAGYLDASPDQREAIDTAFICLCGWSLKTLMERTPPQRDADDA